MPRAKKGPGIQKVNYERRREPFVSLSLISLCLYPYVRHPKMMVYTILLVKMGKNVQFSTAVVVHSFFCAKFLSVLLRQNWEGGGSKQIYLCWVYILNVYECSWCSGCFRRRKISCTGAFLWLKKVPERNVDVHFFHTITNHCASQFIKIVTKYRYIMIRLVFLVKLCLESNVVIQISRITISISLSTLRTYVYTIHVRSHVE